MKKTLENILYEWPKSFIRDNDLTILLPSSANSRYSLVKRALKEEKLIRCKKGLYLIGKPYQRKFPDLLEFAQLIYGPSYISLESALSYHGLIPEAVYTITSVSSKRNSEFRTSLGHFSFSHVPSQNFYMGVERVEENNAIFLIATPWKALADYIYVYRKSWENLKEISVDLRIELEVMRDLDRIELKILAEHYHSKRVRIILLKMLKGLSNGY